MVRTPASFQSVKRTRKRRPGRFRRIVRSILLLIVFLWLGVCGVLLLLRFVNPPTTMVQLQRRIESFFAEGSYEKRQTWRPLNRISADLQHAVIAAEDGRFYEHSGIDWKQVDVVLEDAREKGEVSRGASTITQQLIKNLFFTTHRNPLRKAAEYMLARPAEVILGKQRVLELYLNVAEWGPGVYGAEAAAQHHYRTSAATLSRERAARLAAILPAPRRRKPERMNHYSSQIMMRMRQMGW